VWDHAGDEPADAGWEVAPDDLTLVVDGSSSSGRTGATPGTAWCTCAARSTRRRAGSRPGRREPRRPVRGPGAAPERYHPAQRRYLAEVDPGARADIVVDHRDPANLPEALAATGWALETLHDDPHRYLAVARRR